MEGGLRSAAPRDAWVKPRLLRPQGHGDAVLEATAGVSTMLMDVGGPAITTPHEPTPMALSLSAAPYTPLLPMNQSAMAVSVSPAALQAKEAPTPDVAILPPPPPPPVKPSSPRVRLISSVAPPCSPSAGGPPIRQSKRRRTQRSTVAARRPRAADQPLFAAIEHTAAHISLTVFDAHGRTVATHRIDHRSSAPRKGWAEQCPIAAISAIQACIQSTVEMLQTLGHRVDAVQSVGVSTDGTALVVWDKVSGKPLSNAIVAGDSRATAVAATIAQQKDAVDIAIKTGQVFTAALPACKLRWLCENNVGVKQAQVENRLMCGTMEAWIIYSLCGGDCAYSTDITSAAATGLFDLRGSTWDNEMCELFGVDAVALPHVRTNCESFGELTDVGGLLKGLQISGCISTQQATALGRGGCLSAGTAAVTYGVGEDGMSVSASINTGCTFPISPTTDLRPTVCHQLGPKAPRFFGVVGEAVGATMGLRWLTQQMQLVASIDEAERVASTVRDSGDAFFVSPGSGACGNLMGISQFVSRGHIARAVLDSVCFETHRLLSESTAAAGDCAVRVLHADGPLARHRVLMQLQANATGVPVTAQTVPDDTAASLGAALAGALGAGVLASPERLHSVASTTQRNSLCTFAVSTTAIERAARLHRWNDARRRTAGWTAHI
eukprot:m.199477 g.199477  ORF g.199477 m.199477 type:complete len:666 (-) comp25172_c2_seq2:223-2220(-)